jgi:hypothetical protein
MALIYSSNNIATHGDAMTRMTVKAATATTMMTMTVAAMTMLTKTVATAMTMMPVTTHRDF